MKTPYLILLATLLAPVARAQSQPQPVFDQVTSKEFLTQLQQDGVYNFISAKMAESLIVHRVDPVMPHGHMVARVSGTVIIAFEITKEGKVRHAMVTSGPKLLQAPVLAAVKQWTFKPYPLRGEPVTVATSLQLTVSNF
jgi:TonB family protein